MKTCSMCGIPKDMTDFYKNPRSSDGRHSRCKACERAYMHGPLARPAHKLRKNLPDHRCGLCRKVGHYSPDCPLRRMVPASELAAPDVYVGVSRDAGDGGGLLLAGYV